MDKVLRIPPELPRPSPSCLAKLSAAEQWEHISVTPRFLRLWFSFSLLLDVIIMTTVYIWGWCAAGQSVLVSLPAIGHVVLVTGVLIAAHNLGPIPYATIICPACALLKIYIVICPFTQTVQNRPWGSASLHIIAGTISTFLMHFAYVVAAESRKRKPHRLLDFRLDVAFSGIAAVCRHLDNLADMDTGFILLEQVTYVQLTLGFIEMLVAIILGCGGKLLEGGSSRMLRFRVAVYTVSLCCEIGLICNYILKWRMLHNTPHMIGKTGHDDTYTMASSSLTRNAAAHIAVTSVLTFGMFAANVYGLRRSLEALSKFRKHVSRLLSPARQLKASHVVPVDSTVLAQWEPHRAQPVLASCSREHHRLCVNGGRADVDMQEELGVDGHGDTSLLVCPDAMSSHQPICRDDVHSGSDQLPQGSSDMSSTHATLSKGQWCHGDSLEIQSAGLTSSSFARRSDTTKSGRRSTWCSIEGRSLTSLSKRLSQHQEGGAFAPRQDLSVPSRELSLESCSRSSQAVSCIGGRHGLPAAGHGTAPGEHHAGSPQPWPLAQLNGPDASPERSCTSRCFGSGMLEVSDGLLYRNAACSRWHSMDTTVLVTTAISVQSSAQWPRCDDAARCEQPLKFVVSRDRRRSAVIQRKQRDPSAGDATPGLTCAQQQQKNEAVACGPDVVAIQPAAKTASSLETRSDTCCGEISGRGGCHSHEGPPPGSASASSMDHASAAASHADAGE